MPYDGKNNPCEARKTEEALPRIPNGQLLLFPKDARELCSELGHQRSAIMKLFEDGVLSFDPEQSGPLDQAEETELRFLGTLLRYDLPAEVLSRLLDGLEFPYHYSFSAVYFDWFSECWKPLPQPLDVEEVFDNWLQELTDAKDIAQLTALNERIKEILNAK